MKFRILEFMRKKYNIMDNENFYLNITKEENRFLYNRERLEMIRKFTVYFHHCRPVHSDEFHILAEMSMDAAVEADAVEAGYHKEYLQGHLYGQ